MTCYYPNGAVALDHTPCNGGTAATHCCSTQDACLTNHYCFSSSGDTPNAIVRGSCTDKSWRDAACPLQCSDVSTDSLALLNMATSNNRTGTAQWCCSKYNQARDQCQDATHGQDAPWTLPNGRVIYDRATGATEPTNVTTASKSSTIGREAGIGAGIGVPLLLVIIALAILYARSARESKRLKQQIQGMGTLPGNGQPGLTSEKAQPTVTQRWELGAASPDNKMYLSGTPIAELADRPTTYRKN